MCKKWFSALCAVLMFTCLCGCGRTGGSSDSSETTGHNYAGYAFESVEQLIKYIQVQKEDYGMLLHGLPAEEASAGTPFVLVPNAELLASGKLRGEARPGHIFYTYFLNDFDPSSSFDETEVENVGSEINNQELGEPSSKPDDYANKLQEAIDGGDYSALVPSKQQIEYNKNYISFDYDCYGDDGEAGLKYLVESNAGVVKPLEGHSGVYYSDCNYLHDNSLFGYMYYWAYDSYNCSAYVPVELSEQFIKETNGLKSFLQKVYF